MQTQGQPLPRTLLLLAALLGLSGATGAAEPVPEIRRPDLPAQADGAALTLRVIPEACVRLEGRFTGAPAKPFDLAAEPSRARCLPRARLVDAASVRPMPQPGWLLNDVIRIPSARCPARVAVVRIWREGRIDSVPARDAQGRVRVYLKDSMTPAARSRRDALPRYVVQLAVQGQACR